MKPKKHFTHVNQLVLRGNQKHGRTEPVITVKHGSKNRYGYRAKLEGKISLLYAGNGKPLISCGARVALISDQEPEVFEAPGEPEKQGIEIRIQGPIVNRNKRYDELATVVEIYSEDGSVTHCYGAEIEGEVTVAQIVGADSQYISIWVQGSVRPINDPPAKADEAA